MSTWADLGPKFVHVVLDQVSSLWFKTQQRMKSTLHTILTTKKQNYQTRTVSHGALMLQLVSQGIHYMVIYHYIATDSNSPPMHCLTYF